jgi:hypothetical protein
MIKGGLLDGTLRNILTDVIDKFTKGDLKAPRPLNSIKLVE